MDGNPATVTCTWLYLNFEQILGFGFGTDVRTYVPKSKISAISSYRISVSNQSKLKQKSMSMIAILRTHASTRARAYIPPTAVWFGVKKQKQRKMLSLLITIAVVLQGRFGGTSEVEPHMLGVFGNNMVLQHDKPLLYGCGAQPNASISAVISPSSSSLAAAPAPDQTPSSVSAAAHSRPNVETVHVYADESGCFEFKLTPRPPMTGSNISGFVVQVKGSTPGSTSAPSFATARNVLYGHIVLCGGQSNMVHPVSYDFNATAQLQAVHLLPNLRLMQVGRQWSNGAGTKLPLGCTSEHTVPNLTPGCSVRNQWWPATVNNTEFAAGFSAACYFTAQALMRDEWGAEAAVGLVESDWGGSASQTWQTRDFAQKYGCTVAPPQDPPLPSASCPLTEKGISPTKEFNWACLYHGMIEPLARSLRPELALWYQGEANQRDDLTSPDTTFHSDYQCLLEAMVTEWRRAFSLPNLPFFAVQLSAYWGAPKQLPNLFPHIRVAQARAMTTLHARTPTAASGYAVTHDIGDHPGGIHPHNKTEVGRRLSLSVRRALFNRTTTLPGNMEAVAASVTHGGGKARTLRVEFTSPAPSALATTLAWGPTQQCQTCCGVSTQVIEACADADCGPDANATWRPLQAMLDTNLDDDASVAAVVVVVVATLPPGFLPRVVRYAWSDYPECVLFDVNSVHTLPVGAFNLTVKSQLQQHWKEQPVVMAKRRGPNEHSFSLPVSSSPSSSGPSSSFSPTSSLAWSVQKNFFCGLHSKSPVTWGITFDACYESCRTAGCVRFAFTNNRWNERTGCLIESGGDCADPCTAGACGNWDTFTCNATSGVICAPEPPAPAPPTPSPPVPVAFTVSAALGSHMVLQRDDPGARVWGTAPAGSMVSLVVTGGAATSQQQPETKVIAAANGTWHIDLKPQSATLVPSNLTFTCASRSSSSSSSSRSLQPIVLTDVLFGDVFGCHGQSNMVFGLGQDMNATAECAAAEHFPNIRLMDFVAHRPWVRASTATACTGKGFAPFSAVCWHMGRALYESLQGRVPVGLVASAVGGTSVERWSGPGALLKCNQTGVVQQSNLWTPHIVPLLNMRLRAWTWYQGESNVACSVSWPWSPGLNCGIGCTDASDRHCNASITGCADFYACQFPAMIEDWRARWLGGNDRPFLFVELAPYTEGAGEPHDQSVSAIRAAQLKALDLPAVAMAAAYDYGDMASPLGNIHPRWKRPVGQRLALAALALAYYNDSDSATVATGVQQWRNPSFVSARAANATHLALAFDTDIETRSTPAVGGCVPGLLRPDQCAWLSVNGINVTTTTSATATTLPNSAITNAASITDHVDNILVLDVSKVPCGAPCTYAISYLQGDWPVPTLYAAGSGVPGLPAAPFTATVVV